MSEIPNKINQKLLNRFVVSNNTFSRAVKDNPKDKIELEIGDSKQPDFKPQAKIMRWDNEVNFSLRAEEHSEAQVRTEGKLIKYITPEYEVHQYELDPGDIGEEGGLEFEWVLPKKPASNVLRATIQTKELNFYYQPPLTPEEIEQGAVRPENVVGSYAVYHKTKGGMNRADGMEYKTGKAFHIYRPKVKDADGSEVWGELHIDEAKGELTVTVPQYFLDKAVYPVIVDPTFGYTSMGGTNDVIKELISTIYRCRRAGTVFDGSAGTLDSIKAVIYESTDNANDLTSTFINVEDTGTNSHTQVGTVEIGNITTTTPQFISFTYSSEALSAQPYILSISSRNSSSIQQITRYDSDASFKYYREEKTSSSVVTAYNNTKESPWTDASSSSRKYSIYATYAASAVPVNVSPDSLSLNVSLPTPTITTVLNVNLTPDTLDLSVILPSSGVSIGDGATPAVLTQTFSIPSPTLTAVKNVSVNAGVLSQTFSLPTASVSSSTDVVLTPSQLDIAASIPSPTVSVVKNVSIAPTTLTNSFSVPSVGISIGDTTTPAVLSQTFTIPSPAVTAVKNVSVLTNTVSATSSIPSPTVSVVRNITVAPNPLVLSFSIPAETVVAEGGYLKNSPLYLSIGGGLSIMLGGQRMPVWNTQNRPTGKSGLVGYNREAGQLEIYDGAAWQTITVD